jgi:superfamily I DNA/RNA helicase
MDHLHAIALLCDCDEDDIDEEEEGGADGEGLAPYDAGHFADSEELDEEEKEEEEEDGDNSDGDNSDGDGDLALQQELAQACPLTRRELNVMKRYAVLMLRFDKFSREHSLTALAQYVVASVGMVEHVVKISKDADEELSRWENVQELLRGTVKYSNSSLLAADTDTDTDTAAAVGTEQRGVVACKESLVRFIEHVSLFTSDDGTGCSLDRDPDEQGQGQGGEQEEPVQLMTIHSSKGLEFDVVVVSGVEEGCLPLVRRDSSRGGGEGAEESQGEEEERRLAYVAMTRAKSHLLLTFRRRTMLLRGSRLVARKAKMSRFLKPLRKMKNEECIFVDKSGGGAGDE